MDTGVPAQSCPHTPAGTTAGSHHRKRQYQTEPFRQRQVPSGPTLRAPIPPRVAAAAAANSCSAGGKPGFPLPPSLSLSCAVTVS